MKGIFRVAVAAVLAMSLTPVTAAAQDYPERPIRLFVGFPPGGAADLIARIVGEGVSKRIGQPVVVENRPGMASAMAADATMRSAADGYALLHTGDNLLNVNPFIYSKLPVDPHKDLVPVGSVISSQFVMAVNPKVPANNLKELVELARKSEKPLFYASIGNGSMHHLAMEIFKRHTGIELTHVPYRGGGPAGTALMAGDVQVMFGAASIVPMIQSGKLRGIAVTGAKRWSVVPDLPTIDEVFPGYEVTVWHGWFAPAGTPEPVVDRLRTALNEALKDPAVADRLIKSGSGDPYITTAEEFRERIRSDFERYGKLIKPLGLKIE